MDDDEIFDNETKGAKEDENVEEEVDEEDEESDEEEF